MLHRVAKAAHPPAWSNHGYVCVACRRQWQQSQRMQRRFNSELSTNSSSSNSRSAGAADTWFDTLNDINEDYSSFVPNPEEPKKEEEKEHVPRRPKPTPRKAKPMADLVKDVSDELVDVVRVPKARPATLIRAVRGPTGKTLAARTGGSSLDTLKNRLWNASRSATSTEERESVDRMRSRVSESLMDTQPAKQNKFGHVERDPAERAISHDLDDLISSLGVGAAKTAAKQDLGMDAQQEYEVAHGTSEAKESQVVPFPSFRRKGRDLRSAGGVNNVQVPQEKTIQDESAQDDAPKVWKAKTSPAMSGLGGRLPDKASQSANEVRGVRWGDVTDRPPYPAQKATFDSLAKADQVSPKKEISSAKNNMPFGLFPAAKKETSADMKPAESTGGKAEPGVRGVLSNLLLGLRNRIGAALGGSTTTGEPTSQPTSEAQPATEAQKDEASKTEAPSQHEAPVSQSLSKLHTQLRDDKVMRESAPEVPPEELAKPQSPEQSESSEPQGLSKLRDLLRTDAGAQPEPSTETTQADAKDYPSSDSHEKQQPSFTMRKDLVSCKNMEDYPGSNKVRRVVKRLATESGPTATSLSRYRTHRLARLSVYRQRKTMQDVVKDNVNPAHEASRGTQGATENNIATAEPEQPQGLSIADAMKSGARRGASRGRVSASVTRVPDVASEENEQAVEVAGTAGSSEYTTGEMRPNELQITPLDIPQPPVPYLEYGLDRVLFNPGVYQLKDPASRVYNFDPYLEKIMPATEFDFNALKEYKTSSQDKALAAIAEEQAKRYIGSTSSMTSTLVHFHYLLSNWRPLNHEMVSRGFTNEPSAEVTKINKAPNAIFLRWKNGSYAIDADKEYDSPNVLMLLGKSMELLLTLPTDEYEKYRKSDPREVSEESRTAPEAYQYTTMGDFLMRSQLDAYDPRLPGNGTFDLKTRAVVSVRMRAYDHEDMTGYEIYGLQGRYGSYEREYYDMTRSTMLKYMLQARMGRMNGIFVAYHNVERIFGFQYVPMSDMDRVLHGQTDGCLGDQEFRASLKMLNEVLDKATAKFPEQSLRIHFETQKPKNTGKDTEITAMHVFAEPMGEDEIETIQSKSKGKIAEYERNIMGKDTPEDADAIAPDEAVSENTNDAIEAADSTNVVIDNSFAEPNTVDEATATIREALASASSDSNADQPFLNKISSQNSTSDLKPLFYSTVICQHLINGSHPGNGDRPTNLTKGDDWEIQYLIKEYETTRDVWAKYEDCKSRRKVVLDHHAEDEDEELDHQAKDKSDPYIRFLREMSIKGREARGKIDQLDQGRDVVRVETPLSRHREKVESLDDYMEWMYRKKE